MERHPGLSTVFGDSSRLQQVDLESPVQRRQVHTRGRHRSCPASHRRRAARRNGRQRQRRRYTRILAPRLRTVSAGRRARRRGPHAGLGLGMSIVGGDGRGARRHGRRGQQTPTPPGAIFTVRLPIVRPSSPPVNGCDRRAVVKDRTRLRGLSVMVVDDDEESRHVVAAHLESCDVDGALTAGSAAEAIEMLQHSAVHVLSRRHRHAWRRRLLADSPAPVLDAIGRAVPAAALDRVCSGGRSAGSARGGIPAALVQANRRQLAHRRGRRGQLARWNASRERVPIA